MTNATLEVLPSTKFASINQTARSIPKTEDGYIIITKFGKNGYVRGKFDGQLGYIDAMRVSLQETLPNWIILSQVYVQEKQENWKIICLY